jgi:hypothetical protein
MNSVGGHAPMEKPGYHSMRREAAGTTTTTDHRKDVRPAAVQLPGAAAATASGRILGR